jgi:hypothetical protein
MMIPSLLVCAMAMFMCAYALQLARRQPIPATVKSDGYPSSNDVALLFDTASNAVQLLTTRDHRSPKCERNHNDALRQHQRRQYRTIFTALSGITDPRQRRLEAEVWKRRSPMRARMVDKALRDVAASDPN